MIWPYRPRQGYPDAPLWLFLPLLVVAIVVVMVLGYLVWPGQF